MSYRYIPKSWVFSAVTHNITVKVLPTYVPEHSNPERKEYVWVYNVIIENNSDVCIKLMRRHWLVTDGEGKTQEVHGAGVVGEQPVLNPGEVFSYASHAVLPTTTGFMRGDYDVVDDKGGHIKVKVPAFSLDEPHTRSVLN